MTNKLSTEYIASYLEKGAEQARQLMTLLQEERNILSGNDGAALEKVTQNKEKLAEIIQINTRQCSQYLHQAGFGNDNFSLNKYIETCAEPFATQFKTTWGNLQSVLKQCQDENRINGKLLHSSQRRIKQALSILQGQPVEEDLYGSSGKAVSQSSGNSLTHA